MEDRYRVYVLQYKLFPRDEKRVAEVAGEDLTDCEIILKSYVKHQRISTRKFEFCSIEPKYIERSCLRKIVEADKRGVISSGIKEK